MFEDSLFDFDEMVNEFGEKEYKKLQENSPELLPLDEDSRKAFKEKLGQRRYEAQYYPETKKEYLNRFDKNIGECYSFLRENDPPPDLSQLCNLYKNMQKGILRQSEFDCNRTAQFLFLADGEDNNIYNVDRVFEELHLMDKQVKILNQNAEAPEDRVRLSVFQGLRWLAIHPSNDGNKRMFKFMLNQMMNHLGYTQNINHSWDSVANEVVTQALHGNNLSGFLKAVEKIYSVDLKVQEFEVPPFRIMPLSDHKVELNLEDSKIHESLKFKNDDEFVKFDKPQVENMLKSSWMLKLFRGAKKDLEMLSTSLKSDDVMEILNDHQKLIDKGAIRNLRYLAAVPSSGYRPYLSKAVSEGKLDREEKAKFVKPYVMKKVNIDRKQLEKTFGKANKEYLNRQKDKALEKTEVQNLDIDRTQPMSY